MENQNTSQLNPAGFDLKKIPKPNLITAAISLLGVIAAFLPWASIKGLSGFGAQPNFYAFATILGILIFMLFIGILVINLTEGKIHNIKKEIFDKINLYGAIGVLLLSAIQLLIFITESHVSIGIGLIITIILGTALVLVRLKVIKI